MIPGKLRKHYWEKLKFEIDVDTIKKNLESFSKIISVKLEKNYKEILEKCFKNIGNISHKLLKKVLIKTE